MAIALSYNELYEVNYVLCNKILSFVFLLLPINFLG